MQVSSSCIEYAEEGEWDDLVHCVESNPLSAKDIDAFGMLPLHWACTEKDVPLKVLMVLVNAFPLGCAHRNQSNMLPLHVAINSRLSAAHLEILVKAYPEAIVEEAFDGKSTLQMAKNKCLSSDSLRLLQDYISGSIGNKNASPKLSSEAFNELSTYLRGILEELQQIDMEIKASSPRSASSSVSNDSFSQKNSSGVIRIRWNPETALGLSFEANHESLGAQIKRITGKGETLGIDSLEVGDVLTHLNGKPVKLVSFSNIIKYLKMSKKTVTLSFVRLNGNSYSHYEIPCSEPQDNSSRCSSSSSANSFRQTEMEVALYSRVSELLSETLVKVAHVEEFIQTLSSTNVEGS